MMSRPNVLAKELDHKKPDLCYYRFKIEQEKVASQVVIFFVVVVGCYSLTTEHFEGLAF